MKCRHCNTGLKYKFLDLGVAPPSNAYLSKEELTEQEKIFPLKLYVCPNCWLVQTEDYSQRHELFTKEYAYFSSVSSSWLDHSFRYTQMITEKLKLNKDSFVIEIGSNDGYLLKNFVATGIPCLGIEPTDSTANAAEEIGIPVIRQFFEEDFAKKLVQDGKVADLIIGNNVYAHVPDINDFTRGLRAALKPCGTVTLEFPHLMNLIKYLQYDTVYHEHYSYLSLYSVDIIFSKAGLKVYDVEELSTHGGSLRVYGCHIDDDKEVSPNVTCLKQKEKEFGLQDLDIYLNFQTKIDIVTDNLLHFLREQKQLSKKVVAYGAAAKGNTLLNYANVNTDLISFVCDAAPSKQGKFLPGSHIPVLHPSVLSEYKPDWLLILPWNLEKEIIEQQAQVREWNGKFVVPLPELREVQEEAIAINLDTD